MPTKRFGIFGIGTNTWGRQASSPGIKRKEKIRTSMLYGPVILPSCYYESNASTLCPEKKAFLFVNHISGISILMILDSKRGFLR